MTFRALEVKFFTSRTRANLTTINLNTLNVKLLSNLSIKSLFFEVIILNRKKVFLNVCGSHAVPCPPEITDRELQERVESAEEENLTVAYRVPISLGAPRVEKDNKKLDCDVFDIVVNEAYLKLIEEKQQKYQIGFMVSVGLQGQSFM